MTVSLKKEKKEQLACLIRKTINKKFTKIRKLGQIVGKIVGASQGSRFGALYNRGLDKISSTVCKKVNIIIKHM